jgi:hypothetical protein
LRKIADIDVRAKMEIQHFFDPATSTLTYVVHDAKTGVVIDPVLDYEPKDGTAYLKIRFNVL